METGCDAPPTKVFRWAEGIARAWFCDPHYKAWVKEHPDEAFQIKDVKDGDVSSVIDKAEKDHSNDGMIAWFPPEEIQHQLAIEGGELPEEIHMTLCYFPSLETINPEELVEALKQWSLYQKRLQGVISGVGR